MLTLLLEFVVGVLDDDCMQPLIVVKGSSRP